MSIKPIRFTTDEVRATLGGRKTVTRRVVRGAWPEWSYLGLTDDAAVTAVDRYGEEYPKPVDGLWAEFEDADGPVEFPMVKTPYRPGDILWVRETWCKDVGRYMYRANYSDTEKFYINGQETTIRWRPSIHMPREAARIWLRVTDVRVERLQEIDGNGLRAEGLDIPCLPNEVEDQFNKYGAIFDLEQAKKSFSALWDSTIKHADLDRYGWWANPWVWVNHFERCEKPEEA